MAKIAFVVQRYGLEVNGGSELYCRQVAERLKKYFNLEVLTTCAIDYISWKNEYQPGEETINGVIVKRFLVQQKRNRLKFSLLSKRVEDKRKTRYFDELSWQCGQGPYSIDLLNYLNEHKADYDAIFFMTYLYFTTYFGLHIAPEKSILIPTAHDEPPIYYEIFNSLFHLPRFIIYNTEEEKKFVESRFNNKYIPSLITGIGVDKPIEESLPNFKGKYNLSTPYILYVGRIDESKGCQELFDFFIKYKQDYPSALKLVLIGKSVIQVPKHNDILPLGFLSDIDKFAGIQSSELVVIPSPYESLSMILLEAFSMSKPVLVNGKCEVLKGHCIRSQGGLYYENYSEFKQHLMNLQVNTNTRESLGRNGLEYVQQNYQWSIIEEKFKQAVSFLTNDNMNRLGVKQ